MYFVHFFLTAIILGWVDNENALISR